MRKSVNESCKWWENACKHAFYELDLKTKMNWSIKIDKHFNKLHKDIKEAYWMYMQGILCEYNYDLCRYEGGKFIDINGDCIDVDENEVFIYHRGLYSHRREERKLWFEHFTDHKIVPVFADQFGLGLYLNQMRIENGKRKNVHKNRRIHS